MRPPFIFSNGRAFYHFQPLHCNEREIGNWKFANDLRQGAFQTIQNVYWNVSMSSHSPQSITVYDHIAITFNQLSTEHKNLELENLVIERK